MQLLGPRPLCASSSQTTISSNSMCLCALCLLASTMLATAFVSRRPALSLHYSPTELPLAHCCHLCHLCHLCGARSYMAWITIGPGAAACEQEEPYGAPWRKLPVWRTMAEYTAARLVATVPLDPTQSYVFAAYPHGISAVSGWLSFATEATGFSARFPGLRPYCCTLTSNFRVPFLREYCLRYGLRSCAARAVLKLLARPGAAVVLFPGGAAEALVTRRGATRLVRQRQHWGGVGLCKCGGCLCWCWCGVVWCGVVWCGVVWCGVVWCGVVRCGVVWCGVVWCGVVWRGVVWCGVM
jgi:Diacylglycerol acyltransferase